MDINVDLTSSRSAGPDILPSRPITIVLTLFLFLLFTHVPYALAYLTTSIGVKLVEFGPLTVPLIPEIELIRVIILKYTIRL